MTEKEKLYASMQEAVQKEVELPLGVLLARFHILNTPYRLWRKEHGMSVLRRG